LCRGGKPHIDEIRQEKYQGENIGNVAERNRCERPGKINKEDYAKKARYNIGSGHPYKIFR